MKLHNEFTVATDPERAWRVLTDLEKVAPCLPGAQLLGGQGDVFKGSAKVKVGPITANFHGTAQFKERDDASRRAVIVASGKDPRGQAGAEATITAQVLPEADHSRVVVETELNISGRLAQFGRSAVSDVSAQMIKQFAENLNAMMVEPSKEQSTVDAAPSLSAPQSPTATSLDAAALLGPLLGRRFAPYVAVALAAAIITRLFCRHRGASGRLH